MGEQQQPIGPESVLAFAASATEAAKQGGLEYVEGEMVREKLIVVPDHVEIVPGAEIDPRGATGMVPQRTHSTSEDIVVHHAEDVAMHDAEVRSQNPPIIVES